MPKDQVKTELWNSRGINFHLTSRYPQVESLIDSLNAVSKSILKL